MRPIARICTQKKLREGALECMGLVVSIGHRHLRGRLSNVVLAGRENYGPTL